MGLAPCLASVGEEAALGSADGTLSALERAGRVVQGPGFPQSGFARMPRGLGAPPSGPGDRVLV